jgi:hypothetical protein
MRHSPKPCDKEERIFFPAMGPSVFVNPPMVNAFPEHGLRHSLPLAPPVPTYCTVAGVQHGTAASPAESANDPDRRG